MKIPQRLKIGNAQIELVTTKSGEFGGLRQVSIGGVRLRDAARPICVRLDTPDGILYTKLFVERVRRGADRTDVVLRAEGLAWERGEYHDDFSQPLVWLDRPGEALVDRLTLTLRPVAQSLGGRAWSGFSYEFEFASQARQIHRLLTHATWEIGGRITGNTVLHQGQCNRPVYHGAKNKLFTTRCLRTLDQYGSVQGNSFQLGVRAGLIQGFDFQYGRAGALFQWWPVYESVSSLIESPPGEDVLHVVDEYRFELTKRVRTQAKWVLFTPGALAEHAARDLWWACREHVYGSMRKRFHIAPTLVKPEIWVNFELILGKRRHRPSDMGWEGSGKTAPSISRPRVRVKVAGVEVDHTEICYAMGDHLMPRLAAQGIKRFWPDPQSESDVTVLGLRRKLDDGPHGELHCSSTCATHRFFPAEFWGGIKGWRYLYAKAHAAGIELGHWFAPHLSTRAPIYAQHPEYRMIDVLGFPAGGGLGPQSVVVGDWNTGLRQWVLDDLRRWHDEAGLDYIWTDSYSTFGMLQSNFSARMRTNYVAFARFLADVQRVGIRTLGFEGISPFGMSQFGVKDLRGETGKRDQSVAGQNDFGWWVGEEDMAFDCRLNVEARRRSVTEQQRILFRALASRGYVSYSNLYDSSHRLPGWYARLNHIYNRSVPHMTTRRLLPAGAGVWWTGGGAELWWLFADQPAPRAAGRLERAEAAGWVPVQPGQRWRAWNVYRVLRG